MKAILYFIKLARPYWKQFLLGSLSGILALLAGILLLAVSAWFITATALFSGALIGFNYLFPSALIRACALTRTIGRYFERLINHNATFKALANIRLWVYQRCIPLAPGRLGKQKAGSLLSYILEDVDCLDHLYLRIILPVFSALFAVILAVLLIALASPLAALLFALFFLLTFTTIPWIVLKYAEKTGKNVRKSKNQLRTHIIDFIEGMTEIKACQQDESFLKKLLRQQENLYQNEKKQSCFLACHQLTTLWISPLAFILVFGVCMLEQASPALSALSGFAAFATFETLYPLLEAAELSAQMKAAAEDLYALQTIKPTASHPPAYIKSTHRQKPAGHSLFCENIYFCYPDTTKPVLQNLSFQLQPGEKMALIGPSGSGKTTLFKLFMRFYDLKNGQILIGKSEKDKTPIQNFAHNTICQSFSLVDQKAHMLSADIETNLRLAAPKASEKELWQKLEAACLYDFVRSLPHGLKTWIGTHGALLSGGQRRRLALARAFLKKAPILLLDEPTEGLDADSQHKILNAIENWCHENTTHSLILISHQPEPLKLTNKKLELSSLHMEYPIP